MPSLGSSSLACSGGRAPERPLRPSAVKWLVSCSE